MGLWDFLGFRKKRSILTPEQIEELNKIKRESYFNEAKKILEEQGKKEAQNELVPKAPRGY